MNDLQSMVNEGMLVEHGPEHPTATLARLRAEVEQLQGERDRLAAEQVPATDPRLSSMWENAREAAEDRSAMSEYTTLANYFGIEIAALTYRADVRVTVTLPVALEGSTPLDAWTRFLSITQDERRNAIGAAGVNLPPNLGFTINADVHTFRQQ